MHLHARVVRTLGCTLVAFGGAALVLACSGSSGPSVFNGSWACTTIDTYTVTSPTGIAPFETTTKSTLVLDISSGDPVTVNVPVGDGGTVGDGGSVCSYQYDTSGNTATLPAGQSCTFTTVSGKTTTTATVTTTSGTGNATTSTLSFSAIDSFTSKSVRGATTTTYTGTLSGATTCTQ
jgi:hypothetical protein